MESQSPCLSDYWVLVFSLFILAERSVDFLFITLTVAYSRPKRTHGCTQKQSKCSPLQDCASCLFLNIFFCDLKKLHYLFSDLVCRVFFKCDACSSRLKEQCKWSVDSHADITLATLHLSLVSVFVSVEYFTDIKNFKNVFLALWNLEQQHFSCGAFRRLLQLFKPLSPEQIGAISLKTWGGSNDQLGKKCSTNCKNCYI